VYANVNGIGTVPKPQHQQESGSESDFELDNWYEQATAFSLNFCIPLKLSLISLQFILFLLLFFVIINRLQRFHLLNQSSSSHHARGSSTPTSPSGDTSPQSSIDRGPLV
jgi:hypothetical protein